MLETLLNVVLWLLMFLGIAIAVILGIVVVLLIFVLFVPLRYNGEFIKEPETMQLQVRITWLLRLVRVLVCYEKELSVKAHVLVFKVYDSAKTAKAKHTVRKKNKKDVNDNKENQEENVLKESIPEENNPEEVDSEENIHADDNANEYNTENNDADKEESQSDKSIVEKVKDALQKIICKCKSICDKIKAIIENINYYIEIIKDEETKLIFNDVLQRVFKVIKSIRPRRFNADILVGAGAPDTTGYLMAVAGMLYPCLGRHVNITPDFDNTIFEGRISFKGRITVFVILLHALMIYKDKNLRKLISRLKREEI